MVYTTSKTSPVVEEKFDILGSAPSTAVLPQFNTMLEAAIFVGSVCEEGYTDLMTSIGINELTIYESTGAEILYEAEDGSETKEGESMKQKAFAWIQTIWNNVKKAFETALKWFNDKIVEAKSKGMDKLKAAWTKKSGKIANDKSFGTVRYLALIDREKEDFERTFNNIVTAANAAKADIKAGKDAFESFKSHHIGGMNEFWNNINSAKDIKPALIKYYLIPDKGEPITKSYIDKNINDICNIYVSGVDKNGLKKMYQGFKKEINDLAKEIKNAKGDDFKAQANAIRKLVPIVSAGCFAIIDIMKARYVEATNVCMRVATALSLTSGKDKAADTKATNDNEKVEESAIISTIENAFNW